LLVESAYDAIDTVQVIWYSLLEKIISCSTVRSINVPSRGTV
jgi:hypothetical protein